MAALSIRNEEVCRLIRELTELTAKSMTAVVIEAVQEKLDRERKSRVNEEVIQHWKEFDKRARAATPPELLALDADDLLLDEFGAPR